MSHIPVTEGIPGIIYESFFPGRKVEPDTFAELEGASPSHEYAGPILPRRIEASVSEVELWNAGLDACREAGANAHSRAGLTIRWAIFEGPDEPMPRALLTWIDKAEAAQAAADQKAADLAAERDELVALLDGYERLPYLAMPEIVGIKQYPLLARAGHEALHRIDDHTLVFSRDGQQTHYRNDVTDAERAEWAMRLRIIGHRYDPAVADAVAELERPRQDSRMRITTYSPFACTSWLGGTRSLAKDGYVLGCGQRANTKTGSEMVAALMSWLAATEARYPEAASLVQAAREAIEASAEPIVHIEADE